MSKGRLFIIPNFLGSGHVGDISSRQLSIIQGLKSFIVESEKSARSFLKTIEHPVPQSEFVFYELNEHSKSNFDLTPYFKSCLKGENIGLMSDSGIPCVADPGNKAVAFAHKNGISVTPLSGPSSIYMALMASGFNGQNFAFHGYLPIESTLRTKKIKQLELDVKKSGQTQVFMETPYRNGQLLQSLVQHLNPLTKLCIGCNISLENEIILSQTIEKWKQTELNLHKQPAIFLIGT